MGFSRQEFWSGLLCPPPGDLTDEEVEAERDYVVCPRSPGWSMAELGLNPDLPNPRVCALNQG